MELPVSFQARQLLWSLLLGAALGLQFDALHLPCRLQSRPHPLLTQLADLLFVLSLLPALLLLALYVGEGRLRLFMLVFAALGAALYALTLRKVLVLPVVIILKKFLFFVKKQLLFSKNWLL